MPHDPVVGCCGGPCGGPCGTTAGCWIAGLIGSVGALLLDGMTALFASGTTLAAGWPCASRVLMSACGCSACRAERPIQPTARPMMSSVQPVSKKPVHQYQGASPCAGGWLLR